MLAIDLIQELSRAEAEPEMAIEASERVSDEIPKAIRVSVLEGAARKILLPWERAGVDMKKMFEDFGPAYRIWAENYISQQIEDGNENIEEDMRRQAFSIRYKWELRMRQLMAGSSSESE